MKATLKIKLMLVSLLSTLLAAACGGGQSGSEAKLSIQGTWTINSASVSGDSTLRATIVPSACSVTTPVGTFTVQGPSCFIADNNTGQGSISGTGQFIYPPQGVLLGVPYNPVPVTEGSTVPVDLLFVEADQFGDFAVFDGTGTISVGSTMSGTWTCVPQTPVCLGDSGTFSGSTPR